MALDDFRRWLDVAAQDGREGAITLEAVNGRDALELSLTEHEGPRVSLELDYADAGLLLDWLREGLGVLLARQGNPLAAAAVAGLEAAHATEPPAPKPPLEPAQAPTDDTPVEL